MTDARLLEARPAEGIVRRSALPHFARLLPGVVAAYLLFDRAAAYVHVPGTPVYVGEVLLAIGLAWGWRSSPYVKAAVRDDAVISAAAAFFLWGAVRALTNLGSYGLTWVLRDSALWYYSLFGTLVAALAVRYPSTVTRLATQLNRFVPLLVVWLPVAVYLSPAGTRPGIASSVHVPFTAISIASHKDGNVAVAAVMALAALWLLPGAEVRSARARSAWSLLAVTALLVAGTQNRGGLLAGAAAITVALVLNPRLRRPALGGVVGAVAAVVALSAVQPLLGHHSTRSLSPTQLVANIESVAGIHQTASLQGTERARQIQWSYILNRESTEGRLAYGWGPGLSLGFGTTTGIGTADLRAAHNSHLDVMARLGLVGLGLWLLVWGAWTTRLVTCHRRLARAGRHRQRMYVDFCLITVTAILVDAFFDPSLEGPQVAVLLWTVFGVGAALSNPRWDALFAHGAAAPSGAV